MHKARRNVSNQRGFFTGSHFIMATMHQLGAIQVTPGARCQSAIAMDSAELCSHSLHDGLVHPIAQCGKGPAKTRPHQALAEILASGLSAAGSEVDLERVILDMLKGGPDTPWPSPLIWTSLPNGRVYAASCGLT